MLPTSPSLMIRLLAAYWTGYMQSTISRIWFISKFFMKSLSKIADLMSSRDLFQVRKRSKTTKWVWLLKPYNVSVQRYTDDDQGVFEMKEFFKPLKLDYTSMLLVFIDPVCSVVAAITASKRRFLFRFSFIDLHEPWMNHGTFLQMINVNQTIKWSDMKVNNPKTIIEMQSMNRHHIYRIRLE